jgi:hypothetical protein
MRRSIAVVAGLVVLALSTGAAAHDHEPPKARLKTGDVIQRGRLGSYCWVSPDGNGKFTQLCVDSIPDWPDARPASPDARVRVRFLSRHRPDRIDISWYESIDRYGVPRGEAKEIEPRIVPVRNDRDRIFAYDARFRTRETRGHMYIYAFGIWEDQNGLGGPQDAYWSFHLRVR